MREAVLSVVNQTYLPRQIIVVDDGSTDKTGEIIEELITVQNFSVPIQYIKQENSGLSAARNAGIRACQGNYIAFLDADDVWEANKLEEQIKVFQNSEFKNLGAVYCDYRYIDENGSFTNFHGFILDSTVRGYVRDCLLLNNLIASSASGILIKKECFDRVGCFDEKLPSCEDWDMWMRIAAVYEFDFTSKQLVKIRRHNANMTKDGLKMLIGTLMVYNKVSVEKAIPCEAVKRLRYELVIEIVENYKKGNFIDFSKYMSNSLRSCIYSK